MSTCPRCQHPLPRVRKPTSYRQMMWGGWTCQGCGAELNSRRQLISGRLDSTDGIVVALQPAGYRRSQVLTLLGGCIAPAFGVIGLIAAALIGEWLVFVTAGVMAALMVAGVFGVLGVMKTSKITLTAALIQWDSRSVRPDAISAVRQEGADVIIEADGVQHRLTALGGSDALLAAIEEVRALGRDTGTAADVPAGLAQLRQEPVVR